MIAAAWHKFTAPTTQFRKGNITNPEQAEAATQVDRLQSLVRDIGESMASIDDTSADKNLDNPGSVYGTVYSKQFGRVGTPFTGSCQLGEGKVTHLDVRAGSTSLTVSSKADRQEIHYVNKIEGSGVHDLGPNVLEEHEWAICDGSKVSYKSYSFFSNNHD